MARRFRQTALADEPTWEELVEAVQELQQLDSPKDPLTQLRNEPHDPVETLLPHSVTRDLLAFEPIGGRVVRTINQSIPNNTVTNVTFNEEVYDYGPGGAVDENGGRAPVRGIYLVSCNVRWDPSSVGRRLLTLLHSFEGGIHQVEDAANAALEIQEINAVHEFDATDTVTLSVFQNSGASLDLFANGLAYPSLTMTLLQATGINT